MDALLQALNNNQKPKQDRFPFEKVKAERDELRVLVKELRETVGKQEQTIRKLKEEKLKSPIYDPKMRDIKKTVAWYFEVTPDQIDSASRQASFTYPRQVAMYLCRHLTKRSYPEIGRFFGRRDHTTAIHAERKIAAEIRSDWTAAYDIALIEGAI